MSVGVSNITHHGYTMSIPNLMKVENFVDDMSKINCVINITNCEDDEDKSKVLPIKDPKKES